MKNYWLQNADISILRQMWTIAETNRVWDANFAIGDTIKEKYESLYMDIVEASKQIEKLSVYPNFVVTSREIASIFETSSSYWGITPPNTGRKVEYVMTLAAKWRLYKTEYLDSTIVLGFNPLNRSTPFHGNGLLSKDHYGTILIQHLAI